MTDNNTWSDWLDFNPDNIKSTPNQPGVFMMHAAMKVLYIDGAENMKNSLEDKLSHPCIKNATRFRFMQTDQYAQKKEEIVDDYKTRHEGKLPKCMEE